MGLKEEAVEEIGFSRFAIFYPGIVGGNVHTPGWVAVLGPFVPSSWGTVDQEANVQSIDGLWTLIFGNDNAGGNSSVLYFSAGCDDAPACTLNVTAVDSGGGINDIADSSMVVDAHTVELLASRNGGGDGRVYTVEVA